MNYCLLSEIYLIKSYTLFQIGDYYYRTIDRFVIGSKSAALSSFLSHMIFRNKLCN